MERAMNRCRVCGYFYPYGNPVCPKCHNSADSAFCYKCGSIINQGDNFCPICGDDRRNKPFSPFDIGAKRNPYGPLGLAPYCVDVIDLGLRFSWASCNVGANRPERRGNLYAWGETEERTTCDWSTYTRCGGTQNTCYDLGRNIAGTEFDVARVKWSGKWQIPSCQQIEELSDRCTCEWISFNESKGVRCTAPNGNSIFLPEGSYWLSEPVNTNCAHLFTIGEKGFNILSFKQCTRVVLAPRPGLRSIRPVIDSLCLSNIY